MGFEEGLDWTWERAIQSMSLSLSLSLIDWHLGEGAPVVKAKLGAGVVLHQ